MKTTLLFSFCLLLVAGCTSSPYTYHVDPTPITQGETQYELKTLRVSLSTGRGGDPDDERFASEQELQEQFREALQTQLSEHDIYTETPGENDAQADIEIDYVRTFNHGGNALNKPKVSHSVVVSQDGEKLASFGAQNYTPQFGRFKEIAVNTKIAAFNWDAENEIEYINLISRLIAADLAALGD